MPMDLSEHTLDVQGRSVHCWMGGERGSPALLLLHGGFGDAALHWLDLMPQLAAEGYHVLAPDLPGYGGSAALPRTRIDTLVHWAHGLLAAAEVEQAVIVGNSFGGLIARLLAARYPAATPGIVLVNGGVIPAISPAAKVTAMLPGVGWLVFAQLGRSQASWAGLRGAIRDEDALSEAAYNAIKANAGGLGRLMHGLTLSATPQEVTPRVPVLLLWGEEDVLTPRVAGERIRDTIPGATLELIAGVGHMPHIEAAEVFGFQLLRFLRTLKTRPQTGPA